MPDDALTAWGRVRPQVRLSNITMIDAAGKTLVEFVDLPCVLYQERWWVISPTKEPIERDGVAVADGVIARVQVRGTDDPKMTAEYAGDLVITGEKWNVAIDG